MPIDPEPARTASPPLGSRTSSAEATAGRWAGVPDPLVLALARYVQALDRRYPDGPEQLRRERLAARANMPVVLHPKDGPA